MMWDYTVPGLERLITVLDRLATSLEYKNECEYPRTYMDNLFKKRFEERRRLMKDELKTIELLAQSCDEALAVELNRRLQEILEWAKSVCPEENIPTGS